jgi:S-adenosylmethionine-diacylglycerol 3-amino-3-carboxypropyl transferase
LSTYFQGLNYGLANEDTWIEYDLAPVGAKSFFSVCGSGSRVTPLLARSPEELHVVDLSETQLALCRLRIAAMKNLSYPEYLYFLGYVKEGKTKRSDLMARLQLNADDERLWKGQQTLWDHQGFIYLGKWERHFMKVGKLFQAISFSDLRPVFEARNLEEQKQILKKHWHPKLFHLYTKVVMNEWVANRLLYKGHYAGGSDKKTMKITAADFVFNEVNDLFQNTWVRGNYFLTMIFLNEVSTKDSYPAECNEEIFEKVKKNETNLHYHKRNLLELLMDKGHDFYSLSDTFSYMQDSEVKDFLSKLPVAGPKSQIVIRTFMRKPSFKISHPWKTDDQKNKDLAKKDCTRMYEFNLLERV